MLTCRAVPAVFFSVLDTAGQRCTSTNIADEFLDRLQEMYRTVAPGDPLIDSTFLGPSTQERRVIPTTKQSNTSRPLML